jgi:hypothetical protein
MTAAGSGVEAGLTWLVRINEKGLGPGLACHGRPLAWQMAALLSSLPQIASR